MQARTEVFEGGTVLLMAGETVSSVTHKPLVPLTRVSAAATVRALANLPEGADLKAHLGSTGPLVASRAGKENQHDPDASLFDAVFGRDSLELAAFLAKEFPALQRATVIFLAERMGREVNRANHEEPGRIVHEFREANDPQRKKLEAQGTIFPDFGSIDATPLWCIAAIQQISQDPHFAEEKVNHYLGGSTNLAQALNASIQLIDFWRNSNSEGLIEADAYAGIYKSFPFWKDSFDAYHHRNGDLANPPVSSVEVMGYAYQVYEDAARLAAQQPQLGWNGKELHDKAQRVRATLLKQFWIDDERGGFFAIGTDRDPVTNSARPLDVRASNMGYLLDSGVLDGEDMRPFREAVVRQLFSKELYCPAGIRTLASDEVRFEADSYHNGSVWPKDTFKIARGMARDYPALAQRLTQAVTGDCTQFLAEFLPGNDKPNPKPGEWIVRVHTQNVYGGDIEPSRKKVPQPEQAWTAAALLAIELEDPDLTRAVRSSLAAPDVDADFQRTLLVERPNFQQQNLEQI